MTRIFASLIGAAALCITTSAFAQELAPNESDNHIKAETDWSIFEETDPKECWIVTPPKESVNTRGGNVVSVKRSAILLFVFYRPESDVKGQVAFTGGYPFAPGRSITLEVDDTKFELATKGEWAWPPTPGDDAKIVAAMKRGAQAVVTGQSSRGTVTKDTMSLLGFTAALAEAEKRCTQ